MVERTGSASSRSRRTCQTLGANSSLADGHISVVKLANEYARRRRLQQWMRPPSIRLPPHTSLDWALNRRQCTL